MSSLPEYCKKCSWLFDKMGACGPDNVPVFYSIVSFIPYIIILLFIALGLLMRTSRQVKMAILLVTAYVFADRIIKNLVGMSRPDGACKQTFGFPSSHMVVMTCYVFEMMPHARKSQKLFFIFLMVAQGLARVNLKYHCWTQVFGGVVFGVVYTFLFDIVYEKFEQHPKVKEIFTFLGVKDQQVKKEKSEYKKN